MALGGINDNDSRIQKGMNLCLRSLQIFRFSMFVQSIPHANNLLHILNYFCHILHARAACFIFVFVFEENLEWYVTPRAGLYMINVLSFCLFDAFFADISFLDVCPINTPC